MNQDRNKIGGFSNNQKKEPWLAVLLSLLLVGLGQLYIGKRWKASIVSFFVISSFFWGGWCVLSSRGDAKQGWIVLTFSICIYFWNLIDAWFSAKKWNKINVRIEKKMNKDPYLAILLTAIIPGLGHLYLKQFRSGSFFLITYVALLVIDIEGMIGILIDTLLLSIIFFYLITKGKHLPTASKTIWILILVVIFEGFIISSAIELVSTHWIRVKALSGDSDLPTLRGGDVVVEDMQPKKNMIIGSFIVFSYKGMFFKQNEYLVKRLIGFEGEEIYIDNGAVYVNHQKLIGYPFSDLYYSIDSTCIYATKQNPYQVPLNCVFVLGDNPSQSTDSRYIGGIEKNKIISTAYKVIWPFDRIKTLEP